MKRLAARRAWRLVGRCLYCGCRIRGAFTCPDCADLRALDAEWFR